MEELRSFFCAQKKTVIQENLSGGGSCARKNHTGMYGMQAAELQHDEG